MTATLVVPLTGQALSLDASTDVLAEGYREMQRWETEMRMVRAQVRDELLARMDKELARKHEVGDLFLECDAPNQIEYDADALSRVIVRLVTEDKISLAAAEQAVKTVEELKVAKRGVDKLIAAPALSDEDRAEIMACARPSSKPRRLTVKKAGD